MPSYSGRLIFPQIAVIYQLDTVATGADPDGAGPLTSGYDHDLGDVIPYDVGSPAVRTSSRREKAPIRVPVQVETELEASVKAKGILGHKPRVLNLSGEMSREEKAAAQATLDAESKVRAYSASKVDVIVAVVRMDEGTDWRPCSDVYTTGIPGSIGFDIQLCSRGGRARVHARLLLTGRPAAMC